MQPVNAAGAMAVATMQAQYAILADLMDGVLRARGVPLARLLVPPVPIALPKHAVRGFLACELL